jgi:hypothetical protein
MLAIHAVQRIDASLPWSRDPRSSLLQLARGGPEDARYSGRSLSRSARSSAPGAIRLYRAPFRGRRWATEPPPAATAAQRRTDGAPPPGGRRPAAYDQPLPSRAHTFGNRGYRLQATNAAGPFVSNLHARYTQDLRSSVRWAIAPFGTVSGEELRSLTASFYRQWSSEFETASPTLPSGEV